MMKIDTISDLKKFINKSTIIVFTGILFSVLTGLSITHNKFITKRSLLNEQQIKSAGEVFKSNLSEKLSIIASSTVFQDYLRSGEVTRNKLYPQFLEQISSLNAKEIIGMEIYNDSNNNIFKHGEQSLYYISLKLCYMNQTLDPRMGDCKFRWKLYFNLDELIATIPTINRSIQLSKNPPTDYDFNNNAHFGSFPVAASSIIKIPFVIENDKDYFFYIDLFLVILTLIFLFSWSWYRLSSLLNNYISLPISNLASCLKSDIPLDKCNNIIEIQHLIDEIELWKLKVKKAQSLENTEKLASIAAQLAHDVRSPLTAIDMLVKNIDHIPENLRIALHNATRRISDIANNFLVQYKNPGDAIDKLILSDEYIPGILESIVSEKINQYINWDVQIRLSICDNAWNVFAYINSIDLKRIISNLVNNSVEAISRSGLINIKLVSQGKNLMIEISDNGCGMTENILNKIINEGVSIGKVNGSGLGLSHAFNKIKSWQGDINIISSILKGTIVQINLPASCKEPDLFRDGFLLHPSDIVCIIDDEPYAHKLWKDKLNQERLNFIYSFYTIDEATRFLENNCTGNFLFLVDYDLGISNQTGYDFIVKFNLQHCSTLVTNRYDDVNIQRKCVNSDIKILSKNLISYIPVRYTSVPDPMTHDHNELIGTA